MQCCNCQRFGHSFNLLPSASAFCVLCWGSSLLQHATRSPPKCCNYGGSHSVSCRSCPKFVEAERKQRVPACSEQTCPTVPLPPVSMRFSLSNSTIRSAPTGAAAAVAIAAAVVLLVLTGDSPDWCLLDGARLVAPVATYMAITASPPYPKP